MSAEGQENLANSPSKRKATSSLQNINTEERRKAAQKTLQGRWMNARQGHTSVKSDV
jgi:hypothetical protein